LSCISRFLFLKQLRVRDASDMCSKTRVRNDGPEEHVQKRSYVDICLPLCRSA
jgi:hypothetical protein